LLPFTLSYNQTIETVVLKSTSSCENNLSPNNTFLYAKADGQSNTPSLATDKNVSLFKQILKKIGLQFRYILIKFGPSPDQSCIMGQIVPANICDF
jgi:hypothetical protein